MLGINVLKFSIIGFLAAGILLTFIAEWSMAQVVIVPSRQLAPATVARAKTRPKRRQRIEPEQFKEQIAEITSAPEPPTPVPSLSFAITTPVLKKTETAVAPNPKAWPELLGYEFEVINVDDKGKLGERRKERARFFVEALSGGTNLEMVEIHAGTFVMGNSTVELEQIENNYLRNANKELRSELHERLVAEAPQQTVKVAGFYMSKYEVTQAQWRAVAALPKVNRDLMSDPSGFKGGNRPVEQISWEDAVEFCERLSRATGRHYRLPTEAEWEYACRAGTTWQFSFGGTIEPDSVNYNGKLPYAAAPKDTFRQQTVPVGSLGVANAFGLYDMHGNVWEWCLDSRREARSIEPPEANAPKENGLTGVLRGGAWDSPAGECRSSSRKQIQPLFRLNNVGFRVLVEADNPTASK